MANSNQQKIAQDEMAFLIARENLRRRRKRRKKIEQMEAADNENNAHVQDPV